MESEVPFRSCLRRLGGAVRKEGEVDPELRRAILGQPSRPRYIGHRAYWAAKLAMAAGVAARLNVPCRTAGLKPRRQPETCRHGYAVAGYGAAHRKVAACR